MSNNIWAIREKITECVVTNKGNENTCTKLVIEKRNDSMQNPILIS